MTIPDNDFKPLTAELKALDEGLSRLASLDQAPREVTERIYRASVELLPARRAAASRPMRAAWPGRVALAASMGLAFVLAARILRAPSPGDFTFDFMPISVADDTDDVSASDSLAEIGDLTLDDLEGELAAIERAVLIRQ